MSLSCKQCSKEFTVVGSKAKAYESREGSVRQYCSPKCYHEGRAITVVPSFDCGHCGKTTSRRRMSFKDGRLGSYNYKQRFCSPQCGALAHHAAERRSHCKTCEAALLETPRTDSLGRSRGMNAAPKIYCSASCAAIGSSVGRERSPGFLEKHGYRIISIDGYQVPEHRAVMEHHLGRPLRAEETVHHKNGDRSFNHLSNLELWDSRHPSGQRVTDKVEWCIRYLQDHSDVAEEAGYKIIDVDALEEDQIFNAGGVAQCTYDEDGYSPSEVMGVA